MKRFIRTKDGKIFDLNYKNIIRTENVGEKYPELDMLHIFYSDNKGEETYSHFTGRGGRHKEKTMNTIFDFSECRQEDSIEELIKVGDLVRINYHDGNKKHEKVLCEVKGINKISKELDNFELYTKQGNDYILVARKEHGEWRVI